LLKFN